MSETRRALGLLSLLPVRVREERGGRAEQDSIASSYTHQDSYQTQAQGQGHSSSSTSTSISIRYHVQILFRSESLVWT